MAPRVGVFRDISLMAEPEVIASVSRAEVREGDPVQNPLNTSTLLAPRFEGSIALPFMMGGTSIRHSLGRIDGTLEKVDKLPWDEFEELPEYEGRKVKGLSSEFLDYFAERTYAQWKERGIAPEAIRASVLAVAGRIHGEQGDLITTVNTTVEFVDFPFGKELHSRLKNLAAADGHTLGFDSIRIINDGQAAVIGEFRHPQGKLYGCTNGIFIIAGTGIGSGGVTNGKVDPSITEAGHCLLLNQKTGDVEFRTLEQLRDLGAYRKGRYFNPPQGYEYLETRLAGPWMAIGLLKKLGDHGPTLHALAKRIAENPGDESQLQQIETELRKLSTLDPAHRPHWAKTTSDVFLQPVNRAILAARSSRREFAARCLEGEFGDQDQNQDRFSLKLDIALYEYKMEIAALWGKAMMALRKQYPEHKLVLGSSIGEILGQDRTVVEIIRLVIGTDPKADSVFTSSDVDSTERESTLAIDLLRAIESGETLSYLDWDIEARQG